MERENAFDANPGGDFAHGEGASQPATLYPNNDTFKRLDPLSIPFDDPNLDPHGISRMKFWEITFHLGLVDMC
jgi:hypothetical protein